MPSRSDFLSGGEPARLIPIVADSAREQKSTSVLLAGMRSAFELRQALLKSIGIKVGVKAVLEARTEVVFDALSPKEQKPKDRPDGLLILRTEKKEWRALIEAKVGNEKIDEEQIARYLPQAKARVNWLLRQLKQTNPEGFYIRATRPEKVEPTHKALKSLRDNPELLESDTSNTSATTFEVVYEIDLAANSAEGRSLCWRRLFPPFYQEAGQWLKPWTPPPPKIEKPESVETKQEEYVEEEAAE